MTHVLRPAIRERVHLMIGLAGPSGSGKTFSALRLARGLAGPTGTIAFMDTETGRAKMYADAFAFQHMDVAPPFTPDNYLDGIKVCANAHADVIVIDSMSHEWNGEGGLSDWHDDLVDERVQRAMKSGRTDEWALVDLYNVPCWREPKLAHKRMMARLLQIRSHIVFCLRAEEKIRYVKAYNEERKREETKIVNAGWVPICEKNFMYELTASFLLSPDHPGVPQPIKLQAQHAPMIDTTQPLTERAGELLARWAGGADPAPRPPQGPPPARVNPAPTSPAQPALLDESGAPTPSYKPDDALMMLAKIKGRDVTATDLEIAFARGVRSVPKLALYAKQHWDAYRQAFDELHRRYIAWKDEHA